jgi:hypothetical protein
MPDCPVTRIDSEIYFKIVIFSVQYYCWLLLMPRLARGRWIREFYESRLRASFIEFAVAAYQQLPENGDAAPQRKLRANERPKRQFT